jgi:hypothetical protein
LSVSPILIRGRKHYCDYDHLLARSPGSHSFSILASGGAKKEVGLFVERDMVAVVDFDVIPPPESLSRLEAGAISTQSI